VLKINPRNNFKGRTSAPPRGGRSSGGRAEHGWVLLPLLERHAGGLAVGVEAVLFEVQAAVAAQACFGQAGVDGVAASDGVVRCAMAASVPDVAPRVPEGLGDPEVPRAEASAGKPRRGIHGAACVHARARSRSELGANADGDGVHVELVVVGPGAAEVGTQFELHTLDDAVVDADAVVGRRRGVAAFATPEGAGHR